MNIGNRESAYGGLRLGSITSPNHCRCCLTFIGFTHVGGLPFIPARLYDTYPSKQRASREFKVAHNWLFAGTVHISMQIIRYGARYVFFIRQCELNLMLLEGRS